MTKQMTHIRDILESALNRFRPSADMEMTRLWNLWESALPPAMALNAKPGAFRDGILLVHVSSSVWMQHLHFQKQSMISSLNSALDRELVKDIRFQIASLHH
jgi:predicted nucleic acid-binding Zn ribbon protein